jgi:deoxyribodipyrimidine photo-lyase
MTVVKKLNLPCDRNERLHYIRQLFAAAPGPDLALHSAGGRVHALKKLNSVDAAAYAKTRNFLNGAVTYLSAYLRHGCLSLQEAAHTVKKNGAAQADKLLFEFAWRDYWRQVWYAHGDAIYSDMEAPKVALGDADLPDDIRDGKTGLPCMDGFIGDLRNSGYVHNHGRMWLASYVLHHRKVDWRAAADWFEAQLIDGDIASNHLSWQWVASTFSSKPYFFNQDNLKRYSDEQYCTGCQAQCPFNASYESLNERLFSPPLTDMAKQYARPLAAPIELAAGSTGSARAVLVHDEMLSAAHPLLAEPLPKIFVFDRQRYAHWSLARLQFVADCLSEMEEVEVWLGDTAAVLSQRGIGQVMTQATPDQQIKQQLAGFAPIWVAEARLVDIEISPQRLKRFSRYWELVAPLLLSSTANLRY